MTEQEREQMVLLCKRIAEEDDPKIFLQLLRDLNDLLERKKRRLDGQSQPESNSHC